MTHASTVLVNVQCDYCGNQKQIRFVDYYKSTHGLTDKYACSKCAVRKKNSHIDKSIYYNKFIDFCNEHNYTPIPTLNDYNNAYTKLKYICPKHGDKETTYVSITEGHICAQCAHENTGKKNAKNTSEVIQIVENKNYNKLLNHQDYINVNTKNLKIKCGSCGKIFTTRLSSIMNSEGSCDKCGIKKSSGSNKLTPSQVSKKINSINNNLLLNPDEYINNNTINLKIKCGFCNTHIFTTSLANYI